MQKQARTPIGWKYKHPPQRKTQTMKLTHRDAKFDTQLLAELRQFTIETRNGAVISVSEGADGSLHLHEGSHRNLRIVPVVANSVRIDIVDPFLESAAPMTPIATEDALSRIPKGAKVYSVRTKSLWDWWGANERLVASNNIGYTGETYTSFTAFWAAEAPLLLAANPDE
ncbi:hypothetical protein SEA_HUMPTYDUMPTY_56 [Arthrobacter phage HumptyDumpty]|uniref:Uncharacterized protein n=4 Tax=Klausavirus princesstrina TaxID=1984784 RepID=A0A286N469_9CAUD|nr:hypothetical protein SEA_HUMPTYDUMPTY_56 [Arthrobacter phage HumptyDumpty]ASX99176.1 hypothetical protein SEA_TOPHAT_56 [Arthrobacter phage Tophat]QBP30427.1 hypothetical protein SEA_CHIPPER1996_56 [Arthrobacter phage Chipper1996]